MTKEAHALVIDAEGNAELTYVRTDLETIKGIVGGYIEPFGPADETYGPWVGYCNEEGKLRGLPVNVNATAVACELGWTGAGVDTLVGPVIFLGRAADDPHAEGDFPEAATAKVIRLFRAPQN